MVITLTPDLENALAERARKLGTTPEALALASLRERFAPAPPPKLQGTMADYLKDFIGVLHSSEFVKGGAQLSKDSGKKFTAILLKKHQRRRK
jgi:hypothetical protein